MKAKNAVKSQTPHETTTRKAKVKKPKSTDSTAARKGKLGDLLGHSVVSVIRAMGKAGWDYETARAALDNAGIEAATHTVRIGLKRGRDGQKRIAPLTKAQLETLRARK